MALKSFPKGHLLSSTPLQSPGDSGYFGSGQKRNDANILNSCSPIKESTFKSSQESLHLVHESPPCIKFEQNLNFENLAKNESSSSLEINELSELEFTSPNFSNQFELFKVPQSLSNRAPKIFDGQHEIYGYSGSTASTSYSLNSLSADNDISYKLFDYVSSDKSSNELRYQDCFENEICDLKNDQNIVSQKVSFFRKTKVDFVHELFERNCYSIISYIFSFLSAKELCIASCVSKQWNKAILNDSKANARRQNLITERLMFLNGPSKENRKGMKYGPARDLKNVLSNLTNIEMSLNAVNTKVSNSKFDSFIRESRNSKSKLLKCPRCFHASKRINGDNVYLCTRCSYNFCSNCLNPVFTSHTCFKPQLPNIIVGSKKSKRNLKRL